jgi:hypothetical protein
MRLALILFFFVIFDQQSMASTMLNCHPGQIRVWLEKSGYACVSRFPAPSSDCIICQGANPHLPMHPNWFQSFPPAVFQPQVMPWWAYQGNLHYPNLHYPGAWNYPHIDASYYPGQGQVFAAKPNVYIQSIHKDRKFEMKFTSEEDLHFLATTPALDRKNFWKGRIVDQDKFEVDGVHYEYLFYDIRLPQEKMQFEAGVCSTREDAIEWMLNDLAELKFSAIARQDFEVHWKVKIPDYPYYCIYPQYNQQLDEVLPVAFSLEQSSFTRSLYILTPHQTEPDPQQSGQAVALPVKDPAAFRPAVLITRENVFKEWGVAFLGR